MAVSCMLKPCLVVGLVGFGEVEGEDGREGAFPVFGKGLRRSDEVSQEQVLHKLLRSAVELLRELHSHVFGYQSFNPGPSSGGKVLGEVTFSVAKVLVGASPCGIAKQDGNQQINAASASADDPRSFVIGAVVPISSALETVEEGC